MSDFDGMLAFVNARLEEEERDALAATPGPWLERAGRIFIEGVRRSLAIVRLVPNARHIARQDPTATLARVAALRALLGEHGPIRQPPWAENPTPVCAYCSHLARSRRRLPCDVVKGVAAIWRIGPDGRQHPDWREEWAA